MRENWESWSTVSEWIAQDLRDGRLGLVLGAGASVGFGLPQWPDLIKGAYTAAGVPWRKRFEDDLEGAADSLLRDHLVGDHAKFARLVREALYSTLPADRDISFFADNHLLLSICALIAASERGQVKNIVSYNFDDLVEEYLKIQGLVVRSLVALPTWARRVDVEVIHPHGVLSLRPDQESTNIVFARRHFRALHGAKRYLVRARLMEVLSSSTVLFIGVSGRDSLLLKDLQAVNKIHPAKSLNYLFWGARFSDDERDPLRGQWEDCGVAQITTEPEYKDLPKKIFEVCQLAVDKGLSS